MCRAVFLTILLCGLAVADSRGQSSTPLRAEVTIRLPAGARLFINDQPSPCPASSDTHAFYTPPLQPDRKYVYLLRVDIQGGRMLNKKVYFQAGDTLSVDFRDVAPKASGETVKGPELPTTLPKLSPPESKVLRPGGPTPRPVVASIDEDGQLVLLVKETVTVTERRTKTIKDKDGKNQEVTYNVAIAREVEKKVVFDIQQSYIFTAAGKAIDPATLAKRLQKETVVLVADLLPPEVLYAGLNKEGKLVLGRVVKKTKTEKVPEQVLDKDGTTRTIYKVVPREYEDVESQVHDPSEVVMFDEDGKKVDPAKLPEFKFQYGNAKGPIQVRVNFKSQVLDPFFLQVIQDDTLILVLPRPSLPKKIVPTT